MGYWKTKVEPLLKKVFDKNTPKKLAASEAAKAFDDSKEVYAKELEDNKSELQTKVVEIYEASSTAIKGLIKDPKESSIKKNSAAVQKFLDELEKIDFPGSKTIREASSKFGPALIPGPVIFIFEQVSTFIITEEPPAAAVVEIKDKEVAIEAEEKKEEETPAAPAPETVAEVEPAKVEAPAEAAPAVVEETIPAKP
ncbi:plasma membrane-associated cation-binding protein 1-like [Impatiens glandulifera]|uniref:plasma membrane-associated cation-binding protein 1-like n=1 Tax=Impatiens glandulifera TaxID=253017 RepID=UPI001FB12E1C|nr:plasma membrane-associated cation-binding protein 1-like [Impatiens glandulifera]XP_047308419.1 plasma membrane-associated cation-binding protein 1-like [Impatiens glandulifera]XP_047308421.1 plasma membrane-associated cation-binding protein 1-like [Impatiens glandulifera]